VWSHGHWRSAVGYAEPPCFENSAPYAETVTVPVTVPVIVVNLNEQSASCGGVCDFGDGHRTRVVTLIVTQTVSPIAILIVTMASRGERWSPDVKSCERRDESVTEMTVASGLPRDLNRVKQASTADVVCLWVVCENLRHVRVRSHDREVSR